MRRRDKGRVGFAAEETGTQLREQQAGEPMFAAQRLRTFVQLRFAAPGTETTALGAAYLAGLAVGFWQDEAELASLWRAERRFEPAMSDSQRTALLGGWRRAVERCLHWAIAD